MTDAALPSFLKVPRAAPAPEPAPKPPTRPVWKPVMIRLVTGLFVFAVALCALIILRPFSGDGEERVAGLPAPAAATAPGEAADVARAAPLTVAAPVGDSDPTLTPEEAAAAAAEMIAYHDSLPQAHEMAPAPAPEEAPIAARTATPSTFGLGGPAPAPSSTVPTDDTSLAETTAAVLAALGLEAAADMDDGSLRDMTAGALGGIRAATGNDAIRAEPRTALQDLVVEALRQGQDDAYIDALLNEAAAAGQITVPEILVTADGRVDTAVLLSSIVADARVAQGGAAPEAPAAVGGEGVEVRVVQTATETESFRFYTVSPGDSLGAIAVKFYGNAAQYELIFTANRDILASPDRIVVGQRLVIPELAGG